MPKKCKRKTTTTSTCSRILRNRLQTSTIDDSLRQIVSSDVITIQNEDEIEDESEEKYNWESRSLDTNLYLISAINLHLSQITNPLHREFILTLLQRFLR